MIIWLASYPRSGNSLFRIISQQLYDVRIYSIYPEEDAPLSPWMLERLSQHPETYIIKTHELPPDDINPAIYLVRDGRDVLVSFAHFILAGENKRYQRNEFLDMLKNIIVTNDRFGGWSQHLRQWIKRKTPTEIVKYEDLIKEPEKVVLTALKHIGYELTTGKENVKVPEFHLLRKHNSRVFRRGVSGGWKDEMPENIHNLFWTYHQEGMAAVGYVQDCEAIE